VKLHVIKVATRSEWLRSEIHRKRGSLSVPMIVDVDSNNYTIPQEGTSGQV